MPTNPANAGDRTHHAEPSLFSATKPEPMRPHTRQDPGGGDRDRTDDPLLAKQVLSQLSYTPNTGTSRTVVGQGGFEPPTPRLSSVCSKQLSY